ncbi:unnamed protein product [Orchesella dallaii]|uniref:Uncharacterized protein n=1 Tax=Orchesella dallaii TaxID=48710 RepID=A0ABP1PLR0_9HEXA
MKENAQWRSKGGMNIRLQDDGDIKYSTEPRTRKISNGGIGSMEYGSRPTHLSRTNGDSYPQKESDAYAAAYDNGGDDFRDQRHTASYRRASFDSTDSYHHQHHHHQHRKTSNGESVPGKPEDVNGIDWEDGLKRWGNR